MHGYTAKTQPALNTHSKTPNEHSRSTKNSTMTTPHPKAKMLRTPVGQASGRRNERHQGDQEEKMAKGALKGGVKTPFDM
jgi:hypothetical protein